MEETLLATVAGVTVLAVAAYGVIAHYYREKRRAELMRNLDRHEWSDRTRSRY